MFAKTYNLRQITAKVASTILTLLFGFLVFLPNTALAGVTLQHGGAGTTPAQSGQYYCGGGKGNKAVQVSIDFGCKGEGNPIMDMLFAVIRLLSDGVGLVIIASLIVAGIQFTSSRGDPQSTAKAIQRIQSNVTALFLFFFAYALLNYVIPGAVL